LGQVQVIANQGFIGRGMVVALMPGPARQRSDPNSPATKTNAANPSRNRDCRAGL
jgi:hypothetical protein